MLQTARVRVGFKGTKVARGKGSEPECKGRGELGVSETLYKDQRANGALSLFR